MLVLAVSPAESSAQVGVLVTPPSWHRWGLGGPAIQGSPHCCLDAKLCATLCDPMNCSMPGFPGPHDLLELAQVHVHCTGDALQPSHPLSLSSPSRAEGLTYGDAAPCGRRNPALWIGFYAFTIWNSVFASPLLSDTEYAASSSVRQCYGQRRVVR